MDKQYQQKLSHISLLLQVINSDGEVSDNELEYVSRIAKRMGLSGADLKKIVNEKIDFDPPVHEHKRIVLFHQLLILIYIDGKIDEKELGFVSELGFKLGLNPYAIKEILAKLYENPEEGIDPKNITDTFKNFNN